MPNAISQGIAAAVADQIRTALAQADATLEIQVEPGLVWRPAGAVIDVYPADEYQVPIAFGDVENELNMTVRARTGTPDGDAAQALLWELGDPVGDLSIARALAADRTLSGAVADCVVTAGPSTWGGFPVSDGSGEMLGCTWTLKITPA